MMISVKFYYISKYIPPRITSYYQQKIPKYIYQTMKTNYLPKDMKNSMQTWIDINPEYTYYFFDDNDCRRFILENFDNQVLFAYDNIIPGAYKADLWRYCVLYKKGGVYVDIDMIAVTPLRNLINHDDEFISCRDHDPRAIFNAFICCKPGHPFLKTTIDYIVHLIHNHYYGENCLDITGPLAFGKAIKIILKNNNPIFDIGKQNINDFIFKLFDHRLGTEYIINDEQIVFINKYKNYHRDIKKINGNVGNYCSLWKKRNVYR